jgi:hypothetical protein
VQPEKPISTVPDGGFAPAVVEAPFIVKLQPVAFDTCQPPYWPNVIVKHMSVVGFV